MIKEEFLHYVWQSLAFNVNDLQTTEGHSLMLIDNGYLNTNAGPDFISGRIRINDILWVGNIEIHVLSSDWYKHNHQIDEHYDNVILHVVLEEDKPVFDRTQKRIPCLELKERIPRDSLRKYRLLQKQEKRIPCSGQIEQVREIHILSAIEKNVTNRLTHKADRFSQWLDATQNDWEYSFILLLARHFGSLVNTDTFEALIRSIPLNVLRKERTELIRLEALLFGQAGFLDKDFSDSYPDQLKHLYQYQRMKFDLKSINGKQWKFMRMRPRNFPTVRIAQLSALIYKYERFIDPMKNFETVNEYLDFFRVTPSDYWNYHYQFDKATKKEEKLPGNSLCKILLINAVIPLLFTLGIKKNEESYRTKAMNLLSSIPSEQNKIIREWRSTGVFSRSAFDSQGLIELYNNACQQKKCLQCPIGQQLIK